MKTTRFVLAGGKFAAWVTLVLIGYQKCARAGEWRTWEQSPLHQQEALPKEKWTGQVWQPQNLEMAYDQIPLIYPSQPTGILQGHSSASSPGRHPAPAKPFFDPVSADQLTLADLPVDAETSHDSTAKALVNPELRNQKRRSSLFQVFVNFFKKPQLFKILVVLGVMLASFFLMGIFARIAQVVLGVWLSLKVLEYFENHQDQS